MRPPRPLSEWVDADLSGVGHVLCEPGPVPVTQLMTPSGIREPRPRRRRWRYGQCRIRGRTWHCRRHEPRKPGSRRRRSLPAPRWWRPAVARRRRSRSGGERRIPSLRRARVPLAWNRCVPTLRRRAPELARARFPVLGTARPARGPGPCPRRQARDQVHDHADEREQEQQCRPHARWHSPGRHSADPPVTLRKEITQKPEGGTEHETLDQRGGVVDDGQAHELLNVHVSSVTACCTAAAELCSTVRAPVPVRPVRAPTTPG